MIEQSIPWEPVPAYANRYFVLGVLRLDIKVVQDGPELASMVVFAPKDGHGPHYRGVDGWLITFGTVRGYRLTYLSESGRGIQTFQPANHDWGAWEVSPSSWLTQSLSQSNRYPLHHFVITDENAAYEIAASTWESERLPNGWEAEFGFEPPA
jgi:hypothetical protein